MAQEPAATAERAASIFRLPSETAQRFFLLVGAVMLTSLFIYESLYYTVHQERERALLSRCQAEAQTISDPLQAQSREIACRAPAQRRRVRWTAQFLPTTLVAAVVVGSLLPALRRRRRKLSRVPDVGGLDARVEYLATRLGLKRLPRMSWQPRRVGGAATAFGLPARPELEVSPGTVVLGATDPARCDAIVGHELAHLRNRDILIGGFAAASFAAFVLVAAAPFVVGVALSDIGGAIVATGLARLALLAIIVAVVQRGVLRAREHEADVRAASAGIDVGPAFTTAPMAREGWARRAIKPLASHPSSARRLHVLQQPELLLRSSPLQAAAAGFLAFLPIPTLSRLVSGYLSGSSATNEGLLWAAAVLAVPLGGWLAISAVRHAVTSDGSPRTSLVVGASVAAGAVTALLLYQDSLYQEMSLLNGGLTEIFGLGVLAVAVVGFVVWLFALAQVTPEPTVATRRRMAALVVVAAIGLGVLVGQLARVWFFARVTDAGTAAGKDPALAVAEIVHAYVATPWVAFLLAAVALASLMLSRQPARREILALLLIGIGGGVVGFVGMRIMEERLADIAAKQLREQALLTIRYTLLAPALIAAGGVGAAVVGAWHKKERSYQFCLACALVAALVGSTAVMLLHRSRGARLGTDQLEFVLAPIMVYAIIGSLALGALAALFRPPGPAWLRVGLVTLLVVATGPVAAAYVAAPAPLLREIPAFSQWIGGEAGPVLEVVDVCQAYTSEPLAPTEAVRLADFASEAIALVDGARWEADDLRRETRVLRQSLIACREGAAAASGGDTAAAKMNFTRSLCLTSEFLSFFAGLEGRPAQRVPATKAVCSGSSDTG